MPSTARRLPTAALFIVTALIASLAMAPAGATEVAPDQPASLSTKEFVLNAQSTPESRAAKRAAERAAYVAKLRKDLVRVAKSKRHASYVRAAEGPNAFDCSGLVMWLYDTVANIKLPHYSGAQMARSTPVEFSTKTLKPGDLLFYGPGGSTHVTMYIGNGKMIGASSPRSGIRIDSIYMSYYTARFFRAGRIIKD